MAYKGELKQQVDVEISFKAGANQGVTALAHFFSPKRGAKVPEPVAWRVVGGGADMKKERVPSENDTYSLQIDTDLPDGGSGRLEVRQGGAVICDEDLKSDSRWVFWVTGA